MVKVAATQFSCGPKAQENEAKAEAVVREAARQGAQIILLQELFQSEYFCKDQKATLFSLAQPFEGNVLIQHFAALAKELKIVLPLSFFERANNAYFNSLAMIDADGQVLGLYRKSHIPDGPGYQEKFYFNPGDSGFKVFDTQYGRLGAGICWDQWFPEAARCMALMGAELLFYPTAIGSEPQDATLKSRAHWQRVMQGHAGANLCPVIASNRIGREVGESCAITFYGSSFIAGPEGELLHEATQTEEAILIQAFDLAALREKRAGWGVFRDRRPELYGAIAGLDGHVSKTQR